MPDHTPSLTLAQVRSIVVDFCRENNTARALATLVSSGFNVLQQPSLWEIVARASLRINDLETAAICCESLFDSDHLHGDLAVSYGNILLGLGKPAEAEQVIGRVFGIAPSYQPALLVLFKVYAASDPERALSLVSSIKDKSVDVGILHFDLLRNQNRIEEASSLLEGLAKQFPDERRVVIRMARLEERRRDWAAAIEHWDDIAKRFPQLATEARLKIIQLHARFEQMDRSAQSAAEMLIPSADTQPDLDLISRINLLSSFSQSGAIVDTIVNAASVREQHQHSPETWEGLATFLLDSGQVGLAAWLAGQGVNVGGTARAVLEEARPYIKLDRRTMDRADIMAQVTSPAILLQDIAASAVPENAPDPSAPVLLVNATLAAGGAERQFVLLVKSLLGAGLPAERVHVALFSTAADRGHAHFKPALESLGVTVHDLEARTTNYGALDQEQRTWLGLMPLRIRADVAPIVDLCRELRPAVIHGWQDRSSIAAGLAGVMVQVKRIVMAARNMQPDRRMLQDRDTFRDIYRMLCKRPNVVMTANSEAGARDYEDWIGLERHAITVTSNAIDVSEFPVLAGKPLRGRKRPIVRMLGVFRLAANKRPELWMRTVAELRRRGNLEIRPRLVGNGPFLSEIEALREELGLQDLKIESHLSKAEAIYGGADVLLLMSRVEGTPNVVIEAQCCGLAVAACDVGGVREAMMPGNLVLDPNIEAEAAASAIENWIFGLDAAQRAESVKEVRRKYNISTLAQTALDLYGIRTDGGVR